MAQREYNIGRLIEAQSIPANIDLRLVEVAGAQPAKLVRVIVQKMTQSQEIEERVSELGGTVLIDLSMIHGFATEMAAV